MLFNCPGQRNFLSGEKVVVTKPTIVVNDDHSTISLWNCTGVVVCNNSVPKGQTEIDFGSLGTHRVFTKTIKKASF